MYRMKYLVLVLFFLITSDVSGQHIQSSNCREPVFTLHPQGRPFTCAGGAKWKGWDPWVLWDSTDQKYKMWHTRWLNPVLSTVYAESPDGITWIPELSPQGRLIHVFEPTLNSWDEDGIETPTVVMKGDTTFLWYHGYNWKRAYDDTAGIPPPGLPFDDFGRVDAIGLVYHTPSGEWEKHPDPVLWPSESWEMPAVKDSILVINRDGDTVRAAWWEGGTFEPSVGWNEKLDLFEMFYVGHRWEHFPGAGKRMHHRIGYATSPDGKNWTKHADNPVFEPLYSNSKWESPTTVMHVAHVLDPDSGYHLFYLAGWSAGHAYSPGDVTGFNRNPNNPVLKYSSDSTWWNGQFWEHINLLAYGAPAPLFRNDTLRLYHMRSRDGAIKYGDDAMRFGLATAYCPDPPLSVTPFRIENESDRATIYPNPASGEIYIRLMDECASAYEINICDLSGLTTYNPEVSHHGNFIRLDVGELPAGCYIVSIHSKNEVIHKRLVLY